LVWDENRDYGGKYMGGAYTRQMHDMVKRDRNHPSIVVWSFCNEYECGQADADYTAKAYREAAKSADPYRDVTANDAGFGAPHRLDVQGCSHSKNNTFAKLHPQLGSDFPLVLSECCSCTSQRTDRSLPSCIADQNSPAFLPYVTGSLGVWTLMDYFGEPAGTGTSGWPHVSSDFGQFDIAGFPKPHAYWYSANWLQGFSPKDPSRPPLPARTVARVLSLPAASSSTVAAITTAPFAELLVDGKSQGVMETPLNAYGEFDQLTFELGAGKCGDDAGSFPHDASTVQCKGLTEKKDATTPAQCAADCCAQGEKACNTWQFDNRTNGQGCWTGVVPIGSCKVNPGKPAIWVGGQRDAPSLFRNATLVALSAAKGGKVLKTHTVLAAGQDNSTYELSLTLDVPSASTGTGNSLFLDGRDTAMIRCSILDKDALVSEAKNRITWRVVSGPGRLDGISNGDPTSHEQLKSNAVAAWGGLTRAMVKVTQDCTTPHRDIAATVDVDASRSPTHVLPGATGCDLSPIVIEAGSPGMKAVRISIPVSASAADSPFAVAAATAGDKFTNGFTFLDDFQG